MGTPAGLLRAVGLARRLGPDYLRNLCRETFTSMLQGLNLKMRVMAALNCLLVTPVVLIHMMTFFSAMSNFIMKLVIFLFSLLN